ncbi:MAG: hypothetical protein EAZ65_09375 [Verrucomicrobia bacterium]|nr:MAG: hypothetical protein EAZ84_08640 [Verrucomicrobiota bacterium]TAE86660.1 MAG: hypothetical protein EAZ82_10405 [Verrucomicrobiota bacterium]TAF24439.1 MAG: hypothetical protein EAZ71_10635 [Verrucomicrobiota bacterium]TAF40000.1 MAG: hypothetical protein EAZ65_09375 [Verrucomicrobiota bacterium]
MPWLYRLEQRLGWLQFQGLFKYLTFLGVIAYACQWIRPDIGLILDFDRDAILSGEVWRLFTFLFAPMGMRSFSPFGVLFLFCAVQISFLISDSLEAAWGVARSTLYILAASLALAASQFIFDVGMSAAGGMLYTSLFLAFATLFPKVEFSFFFLFPVQVRIFGWITGVILLLQGLTRPESLMLTVPALIPYALWVLPEVIHGRRALVRAAGRRRAFQVASAPESQAFHSCEACGRTERDSADLEFFTLPDGREYCGEHLPPQA